MIDYKLNKIIMLIEAYLFMLIYAFLSNLPIPGYPQKGTSATKEHGRSLAFIV